MKKNTKLIILIAAILVFIGGLIIILELTKSTAPDIEMKDIEGEKYIEVDSNGNKVNTSDKLKETKKYKDYEFKDAALSYLDTETTFTAVIKNTSSKKQDGGLIEIVFYNKEGKAISKMGSYIRELKAGEEMQLNAGITKDMANAYDYKIFAKKDEK